MPYFFKSYSYLLLISLLATQAVGQVMDDFARKDKRIFSIEARRGAYFNVAGIDDSIQGLTREHLKAINKGYRTDFSFLFNLGKYFEAGVTFANLHTSHSTPVVGILLIRPAPYNDTLQLVGKVRDEISQNYYALRIDNFIRLNDQLYLKPGISMGIISYINHSDYAGYKFWTKGKTPGISLRISGEFRADDNWALNGTASLMAAFLYEPVFEDIYGTQITYDYGIMNISSFYIGLGLRYTFTQKNKDAIPAEIPGRFGE